MYMRSRRPAGLGLLTAAEKSALVDSLNAGSNEEFVKRMYREIFEREAAASEVTHQLGNLAGGMTRAQLLGAFEANALASTPEAPNPGPAPAILPAIDPPAVGDGFTVAGVHISKAAAIAGAAVLAFFVFRGKR